MRFGAFEHFFNEGHPLYAKMNAMLTQLDTGIIHLGGEAIPFDSLSLPDSFKMKIQQELPEAGSIDLSCRVMNRL